MSNDILHEENGKVVNNPWRRLREFTAARIGLGRAGVSLPTAELLAFQLSHAQARDAVHFPLDTEAVCGDIRSLVGLIPHQKTLRLHSQAVDRITYLQRPDQGRALSEESRQKLIHYMANISVDSTTRHYPESEYDLAIVVVDGLSSLAVQQNAVPFIEQLTELLIAEDQPWSLAPITIVEQGRVAIGDDIGELLNARAVLVLIGERPGLSSPDSLGLYLTWNPKSGLNDASRNCISNIRPAGLQYPEAARRALHLLREARRLKMSGVNLKDRTQDNVIEHLVEQRNFLLSE
jgi:ethanolamine ammonia-lyase small subunit